MDSDINIWNYIDGQMTDKEKISFEKDLALNQELMKRYEFLLSLHESLQERPLSSPSAGFTDRVMAALPRSVNRVKSAIGRKYLLGFLVVSLLYVIMSMFAPIPKGSATEDILTKIPLPGLAYGIIAGLGCALILLFALDHILQRRLRN